MYRLLFACLIFGLGLLNSARGHFVWVLPAGPDSPARVCFSESPEPGEANLVDKVAATKVWLRSAQGPPRALEIARDVSGDHGSWKVTGGQGDILEAKCDYGVVERGGAKFQLVYYAKCAINGAAATKSAEAPMTFEIAAVPVADGLRLQAVYSGKPVPRAEFVLHESDGSSATTEGNEAGEVVWKKKEGRSLVAARAKYVEKLEPGSDAKAPTEARHYATLVLAAVPASAPAAVSAPAGVSAPDLLKAARAGRAVWKDFHGFTADYSIRVDDHVAKGKVTIDENGDAQVELENKTLRGWLLGQLSSLVQHRLPSFEAGSEATFADEPANHPLGRKIILGDPKLQSVYRIRDDVVTEVNRRGGNIRFTISVLEIERNPEGKYLPRIVSMTTWDEESGNVKSAQTVMNTWKRVGQIDLPARVLEIETSKDARSVKELVFSNQRLTPASAGSGAP